MIILLHKRLNKKKPQSTLWSSISTDMEYSICYRNSVSSQLRFSRSLLKGTRQNNANQRTEFSDFCQLLLRSIFPGHRAQGFEKRCSMTRARPEMLWTQNKLSICSERIYFCSLIFQTAMKLHPGLRNKVTRPSCLALTCLFYGTHSFCFERCSFKHSLSPGFNCLAQDSHKSSLFSLAANRFGFGLVGLGFVHTNDML